MQTLPSSQLMAVPLQERSAWQWSSVVQALASLQGAKLGVCVQPLAGSQASSLQGLRSSQLGGGPPTQAPPAQVSAVVQAFPSLHEAVLGVLTQPVAGTHESSVQTLPSSQLGGAPPTHAPPLQVSFVVQALASSQAAVLLVCVHPVAGSQASSVQTFPSSQLGGGPPTQAPPLQMSAVVQAFASSHGNTLLT